MPLEAFRFASLRDLPDLEWLEAEGLLQKGRGKQNSTARSARTATTRRSSRWKRRRTRRNGFELWLGRFGFAGFRL
jgi:hypothetical protein